MSRRMKIKAKVGVGKTIQARPNFIIRDIEFPEISSEEITTKIFGGYHTTGRDDTTVIKKVYMLNLDEVSSPGDALEIPQIPDIIRVIIDKSRAAIKCPKNPIVEVKCYLYTRNTRTNIDVPHGNTAARLFYNYNRKETFYLDPEFESLTEDGEKVLLRSKLDEHYLEIDSDKLFVMTPGTQFVYTIRDIRDTKCGSKRSQKPRPASYQRLNITVDFRVSDTVIQRLKEIQNETMKTVKVPKFTSKVDMEKHIESLKSSPDVRDRTKRYQQALESGESDGTVIEEMRKIKGEAKATSKEEDREEEIKEIVEEEIIIKETAEIKEKEVIIKGTERIEEGYLNDEDIIAEMKKIKESKESKI